MNKAALRQNVAFRQPTYLAFPNRMHCLVTLDRPPGPVCRPEPQTRRDTLLYEAVVLFNDVV